MNIIKQDIDRYKKSPLRVIKHSFFLVLALLVAWQFLDPTPSADVEKQAEQSAPAKVWTDAEKQAVYSALKDFCQAQAYTCKSGTYVTFTGSGRIKPVVRVVYPLDWYVTKDIRAVSLFNANAVSNYIKFNTNISGSEVDRTMIKLVHPNGEEQRFL